MKVAFFLQDIIDKTISFSLIKKGNPGIGGTQYMTLLIAYVLSERENGINVRLYTVSNVNSFNGIDHRTSNNIFEAAEDAASENFNKFIIRSNDVDWYQHPFKNIGNMDIIPWCHNFHTAEIQQLMFSHPNVRKIICVSEEQRDLYRDDESFKICDYINNCIHLNDEFVSKAMCVPNKHRKHIVVYLGSLVPSKSFHVLAELWKDILKEVPDAELYVIGSAGLYNQDMTIGDLGVAERNYEELFLPHISENGKLLPSVHFCGLMGHEKNNLLLQAKVGIPNPTGRTETFCISALEMQIAGCSVTAMEAPGYYETIINGKMAKNKKKLLKNIITLLRTESPIDYDRTINIIDHRFNLNIIAKKWEELLTTSSNRHYSSIYPMHNFMYRYKWLKEIIRFLKIIFPTLKKKRTTVEKIINKQL